MAEDKKSFLVYCDLIHTIKKMKKEDAGELFLHLLEYTNDLNPVTENQIVELVFEPIKQQLKRDLVAYKQAIEDKSVSGRLGNLKRWNNDLWLKVDSKELTLEVAENIAKSRKVSHTDVLPSLPIANIAVKDKDNVTDNVTDKDIKNNIEPINWQSLLDFLNKVLNKKHRSFPEKVKTQYKARLKEGFAKVDIMRAIENASKDQFHIDNNYKHLTIEFFSRPDKLDKFSQGENKPSATTNQKLMTYDN